MTYVDVFGRAFAETCIIESAVAALLGGSLAGSGTRWKFALTAILASSFTLPLFWFIAPRYFRGPMLVPLAECVIIAVESCFYWALVRVRWQTCGLVSLAANLASWGWSYL